MKLVKNNSKKSPPANNNNYEKCKYNATKFGIFSKHSVMHWENKNDYDNLLKDLIKEYQPNNVTERHLIVELTNTMWSKIRLKYAEKASLQEKLSENIDINILEDSNDLAQDVLLVNSYKVKGFDIKKTVFSKENETLDELKIAKKSLECCLAAENILEETDVYEDGVATLPSDDRDDWGNKHTPQGSKYGNYNDRCNYEDTTESLLYWIGKVKDHYEKLIYELENRDKVKEQVLGSTFLPTHTMDKYIRYENHLDKKFEKTLGMFFKLREIRTNGGLSKSVL